MKSHAENGIFAFGFNSVMYRSAGQRIRNLEDKINRRVNGDHTVGNGNFVRLESLRAAQRHALFQILKGAIVIAVGVGAAVAGISTLDGCEKHESKKDVTAIVFDL